MSDTFILCPKCGEELLRSFSAPAYYCTNCFAHYSEEYIRIVTTEYLKGEEDEEKRIV